VETAPCPPGTGDRQRCRPVLDFIKNFPRLLRPCSEPRDKHSGMADFLAVVGIIIFAVAMLALIKGLERV
jgi:hypothetical protein